MAMRRWDPFRDLMPFSVVFELPRLKADDVEVPKTEKPEPKRIEVKASS